MHNYGLVLSFFDQLLCAVGRKNIEDETAEHFFAELYPILFVRAHDLDPEQIAALYVHAFSQEEPVHTDQLIEALAARDYSSYNPGTLAALSSILRTAHNNEVTLDRAVYKEATTAILDRAIKQGVGQEPITPDWKRPKRGLEARNGCAQCSRLDSFLQDGGQRSYICYLVKSQKQHYESLIFHSQDGHRYDVTITPPDTTAILDQLRMDNLRLTRKDKKKYDPRVEKWKYQVTKRTDLSDAEHKEWLSRAIVFQQTIRSMVPDATLRVLLGSRYDEIVQLQAVKIATAHLCQDNNLASRTLPRHAVLAQVLPPGMTADQVRAMFEVSQRCKAHQV